MIKTNLLERGHEPRNLQVVLEALTPNIRMVLVFDSGEFLEIEPREQSQEENSQSGGDEPDRDEHEDETAEEGETVESLCQTLTV